MAFILNASLNDMAYILIFSSFGMPIARIAAYVPNLLCFLQDSSWNLEHKVATQYSTSMTAFILNASLNDMAHILIFTSFGMPIEWIAACVPNLLCFLQQSSWRHFMALHVSNSVRQLAY